MLKRKLILTISLLLLIVAGGCSSVGMTPSYKLQHKLMMNRLVELNTRCQDGDNDACKKASQLGVDYMILIDDALEGRESE